MKTGLRPQLKKWWNLERWEMGKGGPPGSVTAQTEVYGSKTECMNLLSPVFTFLVLRGEHMWCWAPSTAQLPGAAGNGCVCEEQPEGVGEGADGCKRAGMASLE